MKQIKVYPRPDGKFDATVRPWRYGVPKVVASGCDKRETSEAIRSELERLAAEPAPTRLL